MTCERTDDAEFLDSAARVIVIKENVTALPEELVAYIGSEERQKLMNMQKELEPLELHVLGEVRKRGLHDDFVKALQEARRREKPPQAERGQV